MKIRNATYDDLPFLIGIEKDNFITPWNESHFIYELTENPYSFILILEKDRHPAGYLDFWITFEVGQVNKIAVADEFKHQGYGSKLLERAMKIMKDKEVETVTLEVRVGNSIAHAFYLKHGFRDVMIKKRYYEDGEDANYMMKVII